MLRFLAVIVTTQMLIFSASLARALEVPDVAITTAIIDREPVDRVKVLPIESGELYCFTRIIGADAPTVVYHLWYRGEQLMSRVELSVNSPDWRTWSVKRFPGELPERWHVDVLNEEGKLLQKIDFQLL